MSRPRLVAMVAPIALTAAWLAPITAAGAAASPTCHGLHATIVGTDGPDTLNGTDGADVISGLGEGDRIRGLAGNDVICGGKGRDDLQGGDGDDQVYGARARDTLSGGDGDDLVSGGNGRGNIYTADAGDDTWVSGNIRAVSYPGPPRSRGERFDYRDSASGVRVDLAGGTATGDDIGQDTLEIQDLVRGLQVMGSHHDDEITTGPGPDDVVDNGGSWTIDLGGGYDVASLYGTGGTGPSSVSGGTGPDVIDAADSTNAAIDAGPGADFVLTFDVSGTVTGGDGDDDLYTYVLQGSDLVLDAGPGEDGATFSFFGGHVGSLGTVSLDLGTGALTTDAADVSAHFSGLENADVVDVDDSLADDVVIRGTTGDNKLQFAESALPARIYGLAGDDRLLGWDGDDLLDGGPGHDLGQGSGGHDTCVSIEGPLSAQGTCEVNERRQ